MIIADIFIYAIAILIIAATVAAVASKVMSARKNRQPSVVNGIHAKRISWTVTIAAALLLIVTFLTAPTAMMIVNGNAYDDTLWLRASGMCVTSCIALIAAAIACVIFGLIQNRRSGNRQPAASMFIRTKRAKR